MEPTADVTAQRRFPLSRPALIAIGIFLVLFALFLAAWIHYSRLIDRKFRSGSLQTVSEVFASPREVRTGETITPAEVIAQLERSGYGNNLAHPQGSYRLTAEGLQITPGPRSYFTPEPVLLRFSKGRVAAIASAATGKPAPHVLLEPELISNLTDQSRSRRRLVRFQEIPPALLQAVTSVEDKRFFQHTGFDVLRIMKAAYVDLREGRKEQGASTLSMQLARNVFLDSEKKWSRKGSEAFLTLVLESRFSKEQLFEFYANEVYLGQKGTFNIHGFGQAALDYFGKQVGELTTAEAALLAGMIQRPSYFNPYRWPDRALARRQVVLTLMQQNGYLDAARFAEASSAPLRLAPPTGQSTDAPYFLDFVNQELPAQLHDPDHDLHTAHRIYTTLDLSLQKDAAAAIDSGMKLVDTELRRTYARQAADPARPQVALIALDAETGEVRAFAGGRNYAASQLDRVLAKRQPGSVFKPFVYAAALTPPRNPQQPAVTAATVLVDEPTTFTSAGQAYRPGNFEDHYYGPVTVRQALAHSLNIPAVKLAETAGYQNVAALARAAGLPIPDPVTPSLALGAVDATPLEVAGAYTIFSHQGQFSAPNWITRILDANGNAAFENQLASRRVLDPRLAYLMTNLMETVLQNGTAAGVRARGFTLPAAGKTGTSRDGWFAGYTSRLLCVVWVGYDDNRELNLEGARSALPIWTEFMRRAHQHPEYRDAHAFSEPAGMTHASIDPESGQLATPACPTQVNEVFIAGTEPRQQCPLHQGGPLTAVPKTVKGFFHKLRGIFR